MRINNEVLAVLSRCSTRNNALFLPEQLDRKLYVNVNKVLEALGFKWSRKDRAHLIHVAGQPLAGAEEALESVILTGEVTDRRKELQQFFSPLDVVEALVDHGDIEPGLDVLEPSSGAGAIALYLHKLGCQVRAIELDPQLAEVTRAAGVPTMVQDFLTVTPTPIFDRVVMNPPFTKRQEAAHVLHALGFLKPEGRLVSVMSAGIEFRQDGMYEALRQEIKARGGYIERLPAQAFRVSGTDVQTCLVSIGQVADNRRAAPRIVQTQGARPRIEVAPKVPTPEEFTLTATE